jgi:hypothetical protein
MSLSPPLEVGLSSGQQNSFQNATSSGARSAESADDAVIVETPEDHALSTCSHGTRSDSQEAGAAQGCGTQTERADGSGAQAADHDRKALGSCDLAADLADLHALLQELQCMVPMDERTKEPQLRSSNSRRFSSAHRASKDRPVIVHVVRDFHEDPEPYMKPIRPAVSLSPQAKRFAGRTPSTVDSRVYTSWGGTTAPSHFRRSESSVADMSIRESFDVPRHFH